MQTFIFPRWQALCRAQKARARENFKLNLLIKVANFVQISDYRLGPDGRPSVSPPDRVRERKAARLILLAAFSYNGLAYIATPAE